MQDISWINSVKIRYVLANWYKHVHCTYVNFEHHFTSVSFNVGTLLSKMVKDTSISQFTCIYHTRLGWKFVMRPNKINCQFYYCCCCWCRRCRRRRRSGMATIQTATSVPHWRTQKSSTSSSCVEISWSCFTLFLVVLKILSIKLIFAFSPC